MSITLQVTHRCGICNAIIRDVYAANATPTSIPGVTDIKVFTNIQVCDNGHVQEES